MRYIVFDIETQNTFAQVRSSDAAALDISLLVIWDSETQEYTSYLENELDKLWPILEAADILIGYNSDHFDIPLLNKYYQGDLTHMKSLDLLVEIKNSLGRRIKLDQVGAGTLGEGKSGHGLQAVQWWRKGEIEKIRKYCIDDVRITKGVYDYAMKHGSLKFKEGAKIQKFKVDTSKWNDVGDGVLNQSLF